MSFNYAIRHRISHLVVTTALLVPQTAQAAHSLSAIGELFDGLWYFSIISLGAIISLCLAIRFFSRRNKTRKLPVYLASLLLFFILLASRRYVDPRFNVETLLVIASTLFFCLGAIYYPGKDKNANKKAIGLLLFLLFALVINPRYITYNNYILLDEPPFESAIRIAELTHPVFSSTKLETSSTSNRGYAEFLQTSNGDVYYGEGGRSLNKEGLIVKLEPADSCDNACQHCSGDCFDIYSTYRNTLLLKKPQAKLDFQKTSNFPDGPHGIPTKATHSALINIPIKTRYINPNSSMHRGTVKQVSRNGTTLWNPLDNWLWSNVCDGNRNPEEVDDAVWENIDPNYAPNAFSLTIFNCVIEKADLDLLNRLAARGADPNAKVNVGWNEGVNSMFVTMNQRFDLDQKREIYQLLMDLGVNINAQSKKGKTLLHAIIKADHMVHRLDHQKLILSLGVDRTISDNHNRTPVDYANYRIASFKDDQQYIMKQTDRSDESKKDSVERLQRLVDELGEIIALLEY